MALKTIEALAQIASSLAQHSKIAQDEEKDVHSVYSWPQVWKDSACGFDTPAYCAITIAQVVVFVEAEHGYHHVFIDGQFAYTALNPSEIFYTRFDEHCLPGYKEFKEDRATFDLAALN